MKTLEKYGLDKRFMEEAAQYEDFEIGRVVSQYKDLYKVVTNEAEILAEVSGKFRHQAEQTADFPAVGDFVLLDRAQDKEGNGIIHHVLTRKSVFERRAVGTKNETQIVAANIDQVFICMALNKDYNLRRLERYLAIAWDSGAMPVIILTKADLCEDIEKKLKEMASVALGVDIFVTSALDESSYEPIRNILGKGKTASFIGSSGVGKSTLINRLAGEEIFETAEIRADDDKGRHTTTRRELVVLPQGGIVIDTPGMRELGVESADFERSFSDIDGLASACKFKDCKHQSEPGCAVKKAIEEGDLDPDRFENYLKIKKEAKYEGMNSKQIEYEKLNTMFAEVGGLKNARSYIKQNNKRKIKD